MAKLTLPQIVSGYLAVDKLNEALLAIAEAFENTLSRDGTSPNAMGADLDLNGHALLNMGPSEDANSLVTRDAMEDYVNDRASGLLSQKQEIITASPGQTIFTIQSFVYSPGSHNLAVYVDGVRVFTPTSYTETDQDTVTFLSGLAGGEKVTFVSTDFVSTIELPAHTHVWSQITGAPVYTTRWPAWSEVTGKPSTFTPASHNHNAADVTSGRLADARRGVWVQSAQPTAATTGEIWAW